LVFKPTCPGQTTNTIAMSDDTLNEDTVDEEWFLLSASFLLQSFNSFFDGNRNPPIDTQRANWQEHRNKLIYRCHFHRTYRMSPESFDRLVDTIRSALNTNETKSHNRTVAGPIIPEIRLHCLVRYLAGGSYLDICNLVSIPHSTFYGILWNTCEAINACPELGFSLPTTTAELEEASAGFESVSCQRVMRGCIGAIDGWLCPIQAPPSSVVGNVKSYFSGHYQHHGLNVQAIVDHLGRFLYIAVAAPGSQPDVNAVKRTSIDSILSQLPLGYFVLGDNAYKPSEYLVPIFGGADRINVDYDNCNYYMSQCRIRVEMAFGMMVNRFGVLRSPLRISIHNIGPLIQCIARLHNYILNENNQYEPQTRNELDRPLVARNEEVGQETNGDPAQPVDGISVIREALVTRVRNAGLTRP
jgi:hypothetical protein